MDGRIIGGSYDDVSGTDIENVYLFASHGKRGAEFFSKSRIYYDKMVKNGLTVVREFVPCYIKSTGEAGLYDLISKQLFLNQSGQGAFLHGADV